MFQLMPEMMFDEADAGMPFYSMRVQACQLRRQAQIRGPHLNDDDQITAVNRVRRDNWLNSEITAHHRQVGKIGGIVAGSHRQSRRQ